MDIALLEINLWIIFAICSDLFFEKNRRENLDDIPQIRNGGIKMCSKKFNFMQLEVFL